MVNVKNINSNSNDFDAIVVGSGISGGWAAKELCEKGLKVALIERGKNTIHGKDYLGEGKAPWDYKDCFWHKRGIYMTVDGSIKD